LIEYEPSYTVPWSEIDSFHICKKCGKCDELNRYTELRHEAIEQWNEENEEWEEVDITDSDYGDVVGFQCNICEISYDIK
jgi:hypothetical protein